MALQYPDIIESNNPKDYGIVKAVQVSGHKTVKTLDDLYEIADCILSESSNNTDNDAIGQEWYVISEDSKYKLINWENRRNSEGWKNVGSIGIEIDSELSSTSTNPVQNKVINSALGTKQDTLVSGTNIKTINGTSILGSGDITIEGGTGGIGDAPSDGNLYGRSNGDWAVIPEGVIYNADNVIFTTDLVITADIGVHTVGSSGSKTLSTTGKSVKQVFDLLVAEEKNPIITQPSVSVTSTSMGAKEVGTMVTPVYSSTFNRGKYQFGPEDTGVKVVSWTVVDTNGGNKTTSSGQFSEFQVEDDTNYSITSTASYSQGDIPLTNLGNEYLEGRINSGNAIKTVGTISGYRNGFYGTLENKDELTSASIRTLTKSNKSLQNGNTFNIDIPIGALRVVIAYPSSLRSLSSVQDVNGFSAEISSNFKEISVEVEGNNGYSPISYKVYYLDYANPNDVKNTYKVTI